MGKDWDSFAPESKRGARGWDGRRRDASAEGWENAAAGRKGKGGAGPSFDISSHYKPVRRCENCGGWEFGNTEPGKGGMKCMCNAPSFGYRVRHEAPTQRLAFQAWCEQWAREALRVLKPGGFMLAFGGSRTVHRLACAIEDAGFEIRDRILYLNGGGDVIGESLGPELDWVYGSGFP